MYCMFSQLLIQTCYSFEDPSVNHFVTLASSLKITTTKGQQCISKSLPALTSTPNQLFDVCYCLCNMKQPHWLLCVARNYNWSREFTSLSNLNESRLKWNRKLTAKAELDSTILGKMLEKSTQVSFSCYSCKFSQKELSLFLLWSQFLSSKHRCELKKKPGRCPA